jgi:carbohydrate kinase (thermoresistant glucokinase family)
MSPLIIYIMGVSGSGKTTIGKKLSAKTMIPFFDADDFHSLASKEKMQAGHPLTDEDRAGWLRAINQLAKEQMEKEGAIIACSALKEKYRAVLSGGIRVPVHWVFLDGSYECIQERMKARKDHFMPAAMLQSQFETLEIPEQAIVAGISESPDAIVATLISRLPLRV